MTRTLIGTLKREKGHEACVSLSLGNVYFSNLTFLKNKVLKRFRDKWFEYEIFPLGKLFHSFQSELWTWGFLFSGATWQNLIELKTKLRKSSWSCNSRSILSSTLLRSPNLTSRRITHNYSAVKSHIIKFPHCTIELWFSYH